MPIQFSVVSWRWTLERNCLFSGFAFGAFVVWGTPSEVEIAVVGEAGAFFAGAGTPVVAGAGTSAVAGVDWGGKKNDIVAVAGIAAGDHGTGPYKPSAHSTARLVGSGPVPELSN